MKRERDRRWFARFVLIALTFAIGAAPLLTTGPLRVAAQEQADTTPGELSISADEDGFHLQDSVKAGWYIVSLDNTTEADLVADFVLLPSDRTIDDLQNALTTESGRSTVPDWFEQVTFAGGPSAPATSSGQTLIELTPGKWNVVQVGLVGGKRAELTVTEAETPPSVPKMSALVTVTMGQEGALTVAGKLETGYKIWQVTNSDTLTHAFALVRLPTSMSYDQMLALLQTGVPPDGVSVDAAPVVGGIGLLSGGRTIWTVFDLIPGNYVALDYVPIKDGRTFAELGQFAMFVVQ